MATGALTNNTGNLTFTNQKNAITLSTENTFVDSDIVLNTLVTKAILTSTNGDNDHKVFQIEMPNGNSTVTLTFTADTNGNVVVT